METTKTNEYIKNHGSDLITEKLNDYYKNHNSKIDDGLDDGLKEVTYNLLAREDW